MTGKIRKVSIDKLNPAPYNPRIALTPADREYQAIKASIDSFGYLDPIVWNERTGNIVSGHQRYQILKDEGKKEIEVVVVDFDIDKEKACNLAMNKAVGLWDFSKLDELLEEMTATEWDMSAFGFDPVGDFEGFSDDFTPSHDGEEKEYATISLTFLKEDADRINEWLKTHSKEELCEFVLKGVEDNA